MHNYRLLIILTMFLLTFIVMWYDDLNTYTPYLPFPANPSIISTPEPTDDPEHADNSDISASDGSDEPMTEETIPPVEYDTSTPYESPHKSWPMCWRQVNLEQWEIDFFAKLLYCEAGGMGYEGQLWVASAVLNLSEVKQMSIWDMGHQINIFAVAPYVDNATPTETQYEIIYDILANGWIADVCYFRTDYPHSFGTFMRNVENVYFNCQ